MIQASACAKLILFGEHVVLYGHPALAVPLPQWRATVTVEPESAGGLTIEALDTGETLVIDSLVPRAEHPLALTVQQLLQTLACALPDCTLKLQSSIPQGRGLGSGTAVTIALIRALLLYLDKTLSDSAQLTLIHQIENLYHGRASGIDSHVCFYERPLRFVMDQTPEFFEFEGQCPLLLADTGPSPPTREVVKAVKVKVGQNPDFFYPLFRTVEQALQQGYEALLNQDWPRLGQALTRNHKALQAMGVSSLMLDQAFHAALNAGAYGAKLTGGGRGGMCLILAPEAAREEIVAAVQAAGIEQVHSLQLTGTRHD